jgi:hypothetical protein
MRLRHSSPHPEVLAQRASEDEGLQADEFASPACSAHEMDPAYMWAEPRRQEGWLRRFLSRWRSRVQP